MPNFKYSLIFVSKLTFELNCPITFYPKIVVMHDLSSERVLGSGREESRPFVFRSLYDSQLRFVPINVALSSYRSVDLSMLWHNRMVTCMLLIELGVTQTEQVRMFCDNQVVLQIAVNPVFYERMKHIEIGCHYIHEKTREGIVKIYHVKTS